MPTGTIFVFDPSPFNWLYVVFNTMEEITRAGRDGRMIGALAEEAVWLSDRTLELKLHKGVLFHNNQPFTAHHLLQSFLEMQRFDAPHPPGTWLNLPKETVCEVIDDHTVRFHFPKPDGLALGKMRGLHISHERFWRELGFGYAKIGTGEGHW